MLSSSRARRHHALLGLALGLALAGAAPATAAGLDVGEALPDLLLREAGTGRPLPLGERADRARLTVVIFLSPRCPTALGYSQYLSELSQRFSRRGVEFVGVASGVDLRERHVAAYAAHHDLPFPVVMDDGQLAANILGVAEAPEVFVFDDERALVYRGRIDDSAGRPEAASSRELLQALQAGLRYQEPLAVRTRAEGCGVLR